MLQELLQRAATRVVFVVGKGGVGKTTTAGALALASADAGVRTHLLSTDPAHSVSDLFGVPPSGAEPRASPCSDALLLEEFDAHAYARRWTDRTGSALAELVEHGTYLDAEDVQRFLELSMPGVDEVMAALRLVELSAGATQRVVVDTAPTGHALRLLESGALLAGWITTFRAMGRKAGAVASAMLRQDVRLAAESMIDELEAQVRRFEQEVLRSSSFVVVTRDGAVVHAETQRLLGQLWERKLRVAAVVRTGGGNASASELGVPLMQGLRGCDGLRRWGSSAAAGPPPRRSSTPSRGDAIASRDATAGEAAAPLLVHPPRLVFFAGKGGVGKSTCAAAYAIAMAEIRPVTLFGVDPAGSLADVLGTSVGDEDTPIMTNLTAREIDAEAEFARMRDEYMADIGGMFEHFGLGGDPALDRAVLESLWNVAPPGIDELIAVLEILEQTDDERTVVIDVAPTGHFLRLIELPRIALDWVHAVLRLFLKYRVALDLDVGAGSVLRFAKRLKHLRDRLADPAESSIFLVTLDEPLVRAETERLASSLERAGIRPAGTLVNRAGPTATETSGSGLRILAPELGTPPIGGEALSAFFSDWELVT